MRRGLVVAALALTVAALAGCSQVAAIAPVGGNRLAEVRFAANDVLTGAGVDVLTAPVCEADADTSISCSGRAADGSTITVAAPAASPDRLTVTVGDHTLYEGSLMDVLTEAAAG